MKILNFKSYTGLHYLLTYLLTPWFRFLIEQLTDLQLVKKFPAFHGTRMFITALTSVRHLSLSCASPIQSINPHPTSWRCILILSTHLRLCLPSGLFPSGSPTKTLYTPFSSPIRATCPAHFILLDFIPRTILGEQHKFGLQYIIIISQCTVQNKHEVQWIFPSRLLNNRILIRIEYCRYSSDCFGYVDRWRRLVGFHPAKDTFTHSHVVVS